MIEHFFTWLHELKDRHGKRTGSISLWMRGEEQTESYTLLLSEQGVKVKQPGLRTADLVLSMKPEFFQSWVEGTLDPKAVPTGSFAWDGDLKLFEELGYRMSNAAMLPDRSLLRMQMQKEQG